MNPHHYDIVIIGAGLSGLTAAAYLAREGKSVLVLEKYAETGGLVQSFEREGFVFDAGARSIENAGILKPLLADLHIELDLFESPVSIGVEQVLVHMDTPGSIAVYEKKLEELYPDSCRGVKRIFRAIKKVYKEMQVMYGFENPIFKDFRNDRKYLFKDMIPWFFRFLLAVFRMGRLDSPIYSFLLKKTNNHALCDIIGQHFFKGTPTFFALGYFYVYRDYLYPKGGTGTLSKKLEQKIRDCKGIIQCNTSVISLDPAKKIITDESGKEYEYTYAVWAADLKSLYRNTKSEGLDMRTTETFERRAQEIYASRGGDSVYSLYLAVDQAPRVFADIVRPHAFYTPVRRGLGEIHLTQLDNLISKGAEATKEEIFEWLRMYCSLTTYEISIPSLRDHSLSPEGKTGIIASFLLEYDLLRLIRASGWYEECKLFIENEMIHTLNTTLFEGLLDSVEMAFSSSPLSIENRFGNSEGGITGWTFLKQSPAINRLVRIPYAVKTPIPDVFQCGQWTYSPAGIPTAILTGKYASEAILKK